MQLFRRMTSVLLDFPNHQRTVLCKTAGEQQMSRDLLGHPSETFVFRFAVGGDAVSTRSDWKRSTPAKQMNFKVARFGCPLRHHEYEGIRRTMETTGEDRDGEDLHDRAG
jgi:hypothetical protein